ncbi:MAG: hypothetical protein R2729_18830 [Bryobacteraceae bacterium]
MARGWESKDVESQQELREAERRLRAEQPASPEERERQVRRESLELTRSRVAADLENAVDPRRRAQLQAALAHLESELAALS